MRSTADEIMRELEDFQPDPSRSGENQFRLYEILEGFEASPDNAGVIPAMFRLMERCTGADFGSPGPMVSWIEKLGVENYLGQLVESVGRRPTYLNLWMVNRILNVTSYSEKSPPRWNATSVMAGCLS